MGLLDVGAGIGQGVQNAVSTYRQIGAAQTENVALDQQKVKLAAEQDLAKRIPIESTYAGQDPFTADVIKNHFTPIATPDAQGYSTISKGDFLSWQNNKDNMVAFSRDVGLAKSQHYGTESDKYFTKVRDLGKQIEDKVGVTTQDFFKMSPEDQQSVIASLPDQKDQKDVMKLSQEAQSSFKLANDYRKQSHSMYNNVLGIKDEKLSIEQQITESIRTFNDPASSPEEKQAAQVAYNSSIEAKVAMEKTTAANMAVKYYEDAAGNVFTVQGDTVTNAAGDPEDISVLAGTKLVGQKETAPKSLQHMTFDLPDDKGVTHPGGTIWSVDPVTGKKVGYVGPAKAPVTASARGFDLSPARNDALENAISEGRLDPNRVNSRTASIYADIEIKHEKLRNDGIAKTGYDQGKMNYAGISADIKSDTAAQTQITKQVASMKLFESNLRFQADKLEKFLQGKDKEFGSVIRGPYRIMNVPIRAFEMKIAGSAAESTYQTYLTEISNEIGKLSTGSTGSVAELSQTAQTMWAKIHDPNLSVGDMLKLVKQIRGLATIRITSAEETLRNQKTQTGTQQRRGPIGEVPAPPAAPASTETKSWKDYK